MKLVSIKTVIFLIVSLVIGSLLTPPVQALSQSPCRATLDYVHFSSSVKPVDGKPAIKANAKGFCTSAVTQAVMTVQIWKKGMGRDHLVQETPTFYLTGMPKDGTLRNIDTWRRCDNGRVTKYYAKVKINGIANEAPFSTPWIRSVKDSIICCGTTDTLLS
jgi:hypothetical protein